MNPVPTDPKGASGAAKTPLHLLPPVAMARTSEVLALGAMKYGPWNWRHNKVEAMTYVAAIRRHLDAFVEGEDLDPESGVTHLAHIAASCAIVMDADNFGNLIDNRPPRKPEPVPLDRQIEEFIESERRKGLKPLPDEPYIGL